MRLFLLFIVLNISGCAIGGAIYVDAGPDAASEQDAAQ